MPTDADRARVRAILQIEGALVLALGTFLYAGMDLSWWWFLIVFLIPDVPILAYLGGPRIGALFYNAVHTYSAPLLLGLYHVAVAPQSEAILAATYIWFAHIGFDRMIMVGLKYPTAFKHTHMSPPSAFEGAG